MQTLAEYMENLPMKDHSRVMKKLVEEVPLSRQTIYAVRRGVQKLSLSTALKVHEITDKKTDPRSMTEPEVWDQLDSYYQEKAKPKRVKSKGVVK